MKCFVFDASKTAAGTGCTGVGVSGKKTGSGRQTGPADKRVDRPRAASKRKMVSRYTDELVMQSLFATVTNVNFDPKRLEKINTE